MARTAITPQTIDVDGLAPAFEAANVDGNSFASNRRRFLHVKNGSAGAVTVTLPTPAATGEGLDIEDQAISVPAGGERLAGPFGALFHQDSAQTVHVDYSAVTSVTVAVFELP